jgi:hypothetical protein
VRLHVIVVNFSAADYQIKTKSKKTFQFIFYSTESSCYMCIHLNDVCITGKSNEYSFSQIFCLCIFQKSLLCVTVLPGARYYIIPIWFHLTLIATDEQNPIFLFVFPLHIVHTTIIIIHTQYFIHNIRLMCRRMYSSDLCDYQFQSLYLITEF